MTALRIEALTPDAFSPFGEVVAHDGGPGRRYIDTAFEQRAGVTQRLWVSRLDRPDDDVVTIELLERHPFSAQSFVPLSGRRLLIIVSAAGRDGLPDLATLRAFVSDGRQGLTYRFGTWHHGMLALDGGTEVVVVMGFTGTDADTEHHRLPAARHLALPA